MAWTLTEDLDGYVVAAGDFLRSRPVQNTVQLAAVETLRARGGSAFGEIPPLFGWWRSSDGEVAAALLHTPPFPVLLTRLPEHSAGPLAEVLSASRRQLAGVNAEQGDAAAFAAAWTERTGASATVFRRSRLFSLGDLELPTPHPHGTARVAVAADRGLLESWFAAFADEIGDTPARIPSAVDDRLSYGGLTLWEADEPSESDPSTLRRSSGGEAMVVRSPQR
jgi:hypothetical protein